MKSKAGRYFFYIKGFIKSDNKKEIVRELTSEIKRKGVLKGVQSLLHKKAHGDFFNLDLKADLSIKEYDREIKIVLPTNANPEVSIIIPMYNEVAYTFNCVCSIYYNNDYKDYEIIIADDNSTENYDILKGNFENLTIIKNETNLGFLKNCNNAASISKGRYIVFLNNDTQVQKNWLAELVQVFKNFKNVGLVGSKLVYPDGKLQEAGGIIWRDGSGWNYGNMDNPRKPAYNYLKETDYISGASIMISAELWKKTAGFDERYTPAYFEDSDMCFQVRDKGYKVIYQPFSVVVHFEGVTHGTDVRKGVKQYQVINQEKFNDKWHAELMLKSKNGENVFTERDRTGLGKHVLVIDHYLPQIDKDAGSRTIGNFIDVMLELGYSVKFLGENQFVSKSYNKVFQEKGVEVLYGDGFNFYEEEWRDYLKMNLHNFDAILLSRSSVCMPILAYLKEINYKGNIIYYGHDLGYLRLEKEGIEKGDASLVKQSKRIKKEEDYMYSNATNSLAISMEEIAYLRKHFTKPVHYVAPYFFDIVKDVTPYEGREGILFVGGFNHPPNKEAMVWFLEEIYEPLYKQNIKLTIVGSLMPQFIYKYKERFGSLNILSDISIEELNLLYAKVKIAIVPLKYGAGVKGKVIEAMAKGVPVVGTDIAFEGMPKDEGFMYKGVNTPHEMANKIIEVYNDKKIWETLSEFGRKYVSDNFNKEKMKSVFKGLIG